MNESCFYFLIFRASSNHEANSFNIILYLHVYLPAFSAILQDNKPCSKFSGLTRRSLFGSCLCPQRHMFDGHGNTSYTCFNLKLSCLASILLKLCPGQNIISYSFPCHVFSLQLSLFGGFVLRLVGPHSMSNVASLLCLLCSNTFLSHILR